MMFAKHKYFQQDNKLRLVNVLIWIIAALTHLVFSYRAILGDFIYHYSNIVNILYVTLSIISIYDICSKLCVRYDGLYKFSNDFANVSYSVYLYHILAIFILQYDVFPYFAMSVKERFAISFIVVYFLIIVYSILNNKFKKTAS